MKGANISYSSLYDLYSKIHSRRWLSAGVEHDRLILSDLDIDDLSVLEVILDALICNDAIKIYGSSNAYTEMEGNEEK